MRQVRCLLLVLAAACEDVKDSDLVSCPDGPPSHSISQALTYASPTSNFTKLAKAEQNAIVQVSVFDATGLELATCSGTAIDKQHILTAYHCWLESSASLVVTFGGLGGVSVPAHVVGGVESDDLLLLGLSQDVDSLTIPVSPLPIATKPPRLNALVEISGVGADEVGRLGHTGFLVERVTEVSAKRFNVTADGLAGACEGDSGGPALVRDERGRVVVVGVLSRGSASCAGVDECVRADVFASWVQSQGAVLADGPAASCGDLESVGRCFDGTAVYCDQRNVRAQHCSEEEPCGFSEVHGGYRCTADDVCEGVSDLGECVAGSAARCDDGDLLVDPCEACGVSCVRAPHTGEVRCAALQ